MVSLMMENENIDTVGQKGSDPWHEYSKAPDKNCYLQ